MKKKLTVGIIFGGRSGEHEVSLVSATSIISALDKDKYDIISIGIAKDGTWFAGDEVMDALKGGKRPPLEREAVILPLPSRKGLYFIKGGKTIPLDVVFPVLHGTFGEDGTIQGLFEMAGIAYVGAGVMGSSVGMDKIIQKDVARDASVVVTPSTWFLSRDYKNAPDKVMEGIERIFQYPYFVKPANSGSSVGISNAHNRKELKASIEDAIRYDRRILVEKSIEDGREIEISVLGNDAPIASCPGEVISSNEFYDYDAKYVDGKSKTLVPADLPKKTADKIKEIAITVFKALDLCGMARVDFLVTKDEIFFNEANTIPGFTSISMYPKLFEASGISYSKLLDALIKLALERHEEKSRLLTTYRPKEEWYK